MKCLTLAMFALLSCLIGCGTSTSPTPTSSVRKYNGTASVGDFLTISLDANAHSIEYVNHTNGDSGTVSYTVNADGTYTITDPHGNLLAAYEVPGFVLLVETAKSGPTHDAPALITAIESVPTSISNLAGQNFNYMQWRTSSGGLEVGSVAINSLGDIQHDSFRPAGVLNQSPDYFGGGTFPAASIEEDSSGNFFTIHESQGNSDDVVFGTQNGLWAVDGGNGAILGLPKTASKAFNPTTAGTYTAIYYEKANAQTGQNNVETGTVSQGKATLTVGADASVMLLDSQSNTLATGTLVALADSSYIYDGTANLLSDPCHGIFTARVTAVNGDRQDFFVSFEGKAALFASFQTAVPVAQQSPTYTYFYGVGLK
ncbi:MAG: hypothetical protein WA637_17545 [Terriglobales bacterium]